MRGSHERCIFIEKVRRIALSSTVDLFSGLDVEGAPARNPDFPSVTKSPQRRPKKAQEDAATSFLEPATETQPERLENADLLEAYPLLGSSAEVRQRAVELLSRVDPRLPDLLNSELHFPTEEDPFTKTTEEWEAVWYSMRESAFRVYLNMRMEFRRHLERELKGEPNDLKPWTYWAFNGVRPEPGEPVYGLSVERRNELGWDYSGPATDFTIYGDSPAELEAAGG